MKRRDMLVGTGAMALGLGLGGFPMGWAAEKNGTTRRVLFFTKSSGFQHSVVTRKDDNLGHAERVLTELGAKHGFDVTATKDGRVFTPENLAKYDAIFFYTTGDLTKAGTDKQPPMSPEGKQALFDAVAGGKGFLASHCGSDTFHSPGKSNETQPIEQRDPYIQMLGGEFITHGKQQEASLQVVDSKFPGVESLAGGIKLMEEWYALKNFRNDLHVILTQVTKEMEGREYKRPPFPETWARMHGKGRVFYTSLGHREDVWTNEKVQAILLGGLSWATRNVDADVTPNINLVTPFANMVPAV